MKISLPFSLLALLALLLTVPQAAAQECRLPQDTGLSAVVQDLQALRTTARLMHTAAHPDDEDGGMLAYETRGHGATSLLLTLNRGEGGQNKFGSELFDELGILRTLELLEADCYYGVQQRFTHIVDFGYSKTAEETFQKWQGHDVALADMVRSIRTFRPDVLITRFQGSQRDGHGNHEASGILTREAFRAAGDPNRFPEQIKEGLLLWQPKKLYMDFVRADEDYTIALDVGAYSPPLGMSFAQFGLEGLAHQISQGAGGNRVYPGHRYSFYKMIDAVAPTPLLKAGGGHENDFLDGIDTSLPGLVDRLSPQDQAKLPSLRATLEEIAKTVDQAAAAFSTDDPSRCAAPLLKGLKLTKEALDQVERAPLSLAGRLDLLVRLRTKRDQFEKAIKDSLAVTLLASVDAPGNPRPATSGFPGSEQTLLMAIPGQTFTVTARFFNRSPQPVKVNDIHLDAPHDWKITALTSDLKQINTGEYAAVRFQITVPTNAGYTRPYWHRRDPQEENVYTIDDWSYLTLPLPPFPLIADASYSVTGGDSSLRATVQAKYVDPIYGQSQRPLAIGPAMSVETEPASQIVAIDGAHPVTVQVGVHSNVGGPARANLHLELPAGWRAEPSSLPVQFDDTGDYNRYQFTIYPSGLREQRSPVKAVLDYDGKQYSEGYRVVTRNDLGAFYYYHAAEQSVSAVNVKLPANLRVGYVMGAGDDIPPVLQQLGLNVETISPAALASGDLTRYDTIIVGIRAYDVRTDVRQHNKRLLDFVQNGGTLIVQYNQNSSVFNAGHFTPYPTTEDRARVSDETAKVEILAPQDPLFSYPNQITPKDFDGWVQERGLYFMTQWDPQFTPMLSSHDPGEQPLNGGFLVAHYGKGTYIYTGYAFFRQLPAGVPGAIRLFVNALSAGHAVK